MRSILNALRRSTRRRAAALTLALCIAALPATVQGQPVTVVDRCATDVDPGGTNLAQALERGGKITFNCPAPSTIRITRQHRVSRSFDLDGGGTVTLDGGGQQPFVEGVAPNLSMRLANVTVQKMFSTNASGVIDGDLGLKIEIANSRILDSELPIDIAQGEVVVTGSQFERNRNAALSAPVVTLTRSAIRTTDGQPIFSRVGAVTIVDSEIADNGAGSVFRRCSKATITRTVFRGNREPSTGEREGGAAFRTDCDTEVENATFTGNRSASNGGAIFARGSAARITIRGSRFTGNAAALDGGAIAVEAAVAAQRVTLQHTVFRSNGAKRGGAIWMPAGIAGGRAELGGTAVTFTANAAAERGGAIATEGVIVALYRAALIRNAAPAGAAVSAGPVPGTANRFVNALFVLNAGGGAAFEGSGAQFVNATILGSEGAGIALTAAGSQAAIRLANTVIENNRRGNCAGNAAGFVSDGGNLQFPGTSCGTRITVAAAMLDTFYAPMIGGAARGNGRDDICVGALVRGRDFYGKRRPEADHCSIGAVEGDLKRTVERVKGKGGGAGSPGGQCAAASASTCECAELPNARGGPRGTEQAERRITELLAAGVDFSVDETELLSWLDTPDFTPYPAIADVLMRLASGGPLRCAVPIDVIVANYEAAPGIRSPRRAADVKPDVLAAAVVEGYNNRHGTAYSDFAKLRGGMSCLRSSTDSRCTSECDPDTPATVRTLSAGASPVDEKLATLSAVGIDFSVDETELRSWLDTPDFTPYPVIGDALLDLTRSRGLRCPVHIDAIVFNYEHTPGVASPRRPADVRREVLEAAVIEGYNHRHGTAYTKISDLLR